MIKVRTLYTMFSTKQNFTGLCSKCQSLIMGQSYTLGIDVWRDGVLIKTKKVRGHENLCLGCFQPHKASFPAKGEL